MPLLSTPTRPAAALDRRTFLTGNRGGGTPARGMETVEDPWDNPLAALRPRLAHLLRRAGFGASKPELDQFEAMGYEATVAALLDFPNVPDPIEERLAALPLDLTKGDELKRWWLLRMRYTTRPLQEKLVLFLHGLLTSGLSKVGGQRVALLQQQNELFRSHGLGSYRDLLVQVSKDPAMLLWLDGNFSRRQHPNENYARELMELFTIGIGNYSEGDVREAARAFTGWSVPKDSLEAVFNPRAHDSGRKTFMGQTGNFRGEDIIDIILQQPASAEFIARRLWRFFAYPNPEPEVVAPLADVLSGSDFNLGAALRHIFLSEAFVSPRAYRSIIRSPVDLVVSTLRVLGLETDGRGLPYVVRSMGQDLFNPPNVAGWPGGPTWLNSSLWLQRANFANGIASRRKGDAGTAFDPAYMMVTERIADATGFQDHLSVLLLDRRPAPGTRAVLEAYLANGETLQMTSASLNRKGRGLLYLLLASPEYQLA